MVRSGVGSRGGMAGCAVPRRSAPRQRPQQREEALGGKVERRTNAEVANAVVFQSENLTITRRLHEGATATFVTFEPFQDHPAAKRSGFGEHFLRKHRISAYHVMQTRNRWYQYPETPAALAAIRDEIAAGQRVVTYGSSMGGYAAFRFSGVLGADAVIACSPQYSADLLRVPWERRWIHLSRDIPFIWDRLPLAAHTRLYAFFDPLDRDLHHVRLIERKARVTRVPLPYSGHPSLQFMHEVGLLAPALLQIAEDTFDADAFVAQAHRHRRLSGSYLSNQALALPWWRNAERLRLMQEAIDTWPKEPTYRIWAGQLLAKTGRHAAAEARYREGIAMAPNNPVFLHNFAGFLIQRRRWREAVAVAGEATRIAPGRRDLELRLAKARMGRWGFLQIWR